MINHVGGYVSLIGIPLDFNSSYLQGAAEAPDVIRRALACDSSNWWSEQGVNLGKSGLIVDEGNLAISSEHESDAFELIVSSVDKILSRKVPLISLGGDHSISYPILRAFKKHYDQLTVIHFDAHPDLYDELLDNRWSHASPFARVMEEGLASRLIQVGIRTLTGHQHEQAEKFGVEIFQMTNWEQFLDLDISGAVYITIDLDVLDPAFAPGISHYEPGGMSVRELIRCLHAIRAPIVGADIVEFNPARDYQGQTAMVGAKLLKEVAAGILSNATTDKRQCSSRK
ncbi:agmatinase [Leeia sp. TBRC 13508]|uniref:Agmatinase n=1 Tax=Leeia speluncae TaxID=2884804 RepID=A0ABS8DA80_9NEIS|nr:agmatinase [Leeia speluncae]MCB6185114.1 agmatinase [Leeia speluncae]